MFNGIFYFYLIYINMKYDNPHRICLVPGGASSFITDSKKVSCFTDRGASLDRVVDAVNLKNSLQ